MKSLTHFLLIGIAQVLRSSCPYAMICLARRGAAAVLPNCTLDWRGFFLVSMFLHGYGRDRPEKANSSQEQLVGVSLFQTMKQHCELGVAWSGLVRRIGA